VYGGGPGTSPYLYDQTVNGGRTTMLTEIIPGSAAVSVDGSERFDVPRNSQLVHLAVLRFHNAVVADVTADLGPGFTAEEIFAEAQRIVRWQYQWIVVHEFLPHTVGQPMTDDVLTNGPKFYRWRNDPFIPVEFSVAAYRFGHSQVRPSYRAKLRHQRDRHRHGSVQRRSIAARRPITRCRASPHMR
jgi:hypothetical protein